MEKEDWSNTILRLKNKMGLKRFFAKLIGYESRKYSVLPGESEETAKKIEEAQEKTGSEASEEALESLTKELGQLPPETIEKYERKAEFPEKKEDETI